jgi:maleylpyruvate isomerase
MRPTAELAGAGVATDRLLAHLDPLPTQALRAPSLLPGWSAAHVVAHLAGNAWSHVRMLDGCLAGEVRDQYEGGAEARAAAIARLAAEPASAVLEHRRACAALAERWALMASEHWDRGVHRLDSPVQPARTLAFARWREVEVHGVDTATGWTWSDAFLPRLLDELVRRLDLPALVVESDDGSRRGDDGLVVRGSADALARWLSGRSAGEGVTAESGPLPVLPPWR